MPVPISAIYDKLRSEIIWLHGRWLTYRHLYAESPKRLELLRECSRTFFSILHDLLFDEVEVCLSKLTDPASGGKGKENHNLSLDQLQKQLAQHGDSHLAKECQLLLETIHSQSERFRRRRNKRHAHWDLPTAMKDLPLPGVSRENVEGVLNNVRDYMNAIEYHYSYSTTAYEHFVMPDGAEALLATLRAGLRYEELVQERFIPIDDWRKGKWRDA
jgi:AbiU2